MEQRTVVRARFEARCEELRRLLDGPGLTSWERATLAGERAGLLVRLQREPLWPTANR